MRLSVELRCGNANGNVNRLSLAVKHKQFATLQPIKLIADLGVCLILVDCRWAEVSSLILRKDPRQANLRDLNRIWPRQLSFGAQVVLSRALSGDAEPLHDASSCDGIFGRVFPRNRSPPFGERPNNYQCCASVRPSAALDCEWARKFVACVCERIYPQPHLPVPRVRYSPRCIHNEPHLRDQRQVARS